MNSFVLYCGQFAVSLHSHHTTDFMKRNIFLLLLLMLPVVGLQAQIINKHNKDKIGQDIKEGVNDFVETISQDAHPTGEHNQWDGFVAPKLGVGFASLPGAGGKPELLFTGGAYIEVFVAKNLGISFEINYQHQGANSVKYSEELPTYDAAGNETGSYTNSGKYNYDVNYINTTYLAHWYPWPYRPVSLYAGMQLSRLVNAKAHLHGGSSVNIKDELHKGEVDFPIGATYEWKQWELDARYFISPRKLASSHRAKQILGNARNMTFAISVAYRIQIF